jgi:hypothetical protein
MNLVHRHHSRVNHVHQLALHRPRRRLQENERKLKMNTKTPNHTTHSDIHQAFPNHPNLSLKQATVRRASKQVRTLTKLDAREIEPNARQDEMGGWERGPTSSTLASESWRVALIQWRISPLPTK